MDALPTYRGMLTIVEEDKPRVPEIDQCRKKVPSILVPFPDRGSDEAFQCSCMPYTLCCISFLSGE
jgi:hypothetical protein